MGGNEIRRNTQFSKRGLKHLISPFKIVEIDKNPIFCRIILIRFDC